MGSSADEQLIQVTAVLEYSHVCVSETILLNCCLSNAQPATTQAVDDQVSDGNLPVSGSLMVRAPALLSVWRH